MQEEQPEQGAGEQERISTSGEPPFEALITEDAARADEFLAEEREKGNDAWVQEDQEAGKITYRVMVRPAGPAVG